MSSPSEFLTFYRRAVASTPRILRTVQPTPPAVTRSFGVLTGWRKELSTNDKTKTDKFPDDEHSINKAKKGDDYDVQTSNLKAGIDSARKSGTGGHATEGKDSAGGVAQAKKDHPEAPDPAIGMQDERGGRGA